MSPSTRRNFFSIIVPFREFSPYVEECVNARDLHGGTAPARVEGALREARRWLETERV